MDKAKFIQKSFDISKDEDKAESNINQLSNWVRQERQNIIKNEYLRLSNKELIIKRKLKKSNANFVRETTPTNIRLILGNIYNGFCQECSFTFLKRNNSPYFEIHHLNSALGHHPKNLVLVCSNCHRKFEYAYVQTSFNIDGWLMKVNFNETEYHINQAITKLAKDEFIKTVYL